jgi:hypothetical protein
LADWPEKGENEERDDCIFNAVDAKIDVRQIFQFWG